jgi:hypothetical protein
VTSFFVSSHFQYFDSPKRQSRKIFVANKFDFRRKGAAHRNVLWSILNIAVRCTMFSPGIVDPKNIISALHLNFDVVRCFAR